MFWLHSLIARNNQFSSLISLTASKSALQALRPKSNLLPVSISLSALSADFSGVLDEERQEQRRVMIVEEQVKWSKAEIRCSFSGMSFLVRRRDRWDIDYCSAHFQTGRKLDSNQIFFCSVQTTKPMWFLGRERRPGLGHLNKVAAILSQGPAATYTNFVLPSFAPHRQQLQAHLSRCRRAARFVRGHLIGQLKPTRTKCKSERAD